VGACVSQRGSHDTPDCGGYGNRQPKTTEQKGPVRGKNPHPGHHAEPSDEQRLDLRSVDHNVKDAGAGYRGLQTGVDCFLCLSPVLESSEFPLSQGGGAPGSRRPPDFSSGRDTAMVKPKDRHNRFSSTLHAPFPTNPICPCRSETRLRTRSANPLSFAVQPRNSPEQRVLATVESVTARPLTALVKEFEL